MAFPLVRPDDERQNSDAYDFSGLTPVSDTASAAGPTRTPPLLVPSGPSIKEIHRDKSRLKGDQTATASAPSPVIQRAGPAGYDFSGLVPPTAPATDAATL